MGYKIPTIWGDGYTISLEPYPNKVFVHCEVTDTKPSVVKEMLRKWKAFKSAASLDLYALHCDAKNKPTHKHFLKMFGFKYMNTVTAKNGATVEVWLNKGTQE